MLQYNYIYLIVPSLRILFSPVNNCLAGYSSLILNVHVVSHSDLCLCIVMNS